MYEQLVKSLRKHIDPCEGCSRETCAYYDFKFCSKQMAKDAADAIEELLKAAKSMHTWIFLNTGDEQAAYDECGLSDKMNAALGYGGQFVVEPPKGE